jgi:plastocyanin
MRRLHRRLVPIAALLVLAASCSHGSTTRYSGQTNANGDRVIYNPEPSTGPFVVVAVDNHFHDIHPVDRTRIAENREFIVKNEGANLHNFTVVGTSISVDIPPGHELVWSRLGAQLKPGVYHVICTYHAWARMTGLFVVTK